MPLLAILRFAPTYAASDSVPAVSGITEAVYAAPAPLFPFIGAAGRDGLLSPGSTGDCFIYGDGGKSYWVFQFEVQEVVPATYVCRVGVRRHTLTVEDEGAPVIGSVHAAYFCGTKLEPMVPAVQQPDGSFAIGTLTRIPCTAPRFAGEPLPFAWR